MAVTEKESTATFTNWLVLGLIAYLMYTGITKHLPPKPTPPTPSPLPDVQPIEGLPDVRLSLPEELLTPLITVLQGKPLLKDNWSLDLSGVQQVTVGDGKAWLSPPAKIKYDGPGLLNIGTTVSVISVQEDGKTLLIDIDRSPIDVKVIPK